MTDVTLFNYAGLSGDDATFARASAERIRVRMKRTVEDVIAIGLDLIAVKDRLPHGEFGRWIEAEFGMGETTAHNMMRVSELYGSKSTTVVDLPLKALYALAAPSTPEPVREAIEVSAAGGRKVTFKDVDELKRRYENEVALRETLQRAQKNKDESEAKTIIIEKEPDQEWIDAEVERLAAEKTGDMKVALDRAKREAEEAKRLARDAVKEAEAKANAAAQANAEKMAGEELAKLEKQAADAKRREREADAAATRKLEKLEGLKKQERDLHSAINGYGNAEVEAKEIHKALADANAAMVQVGLVFADLEYSHDERTVRLIQRSAEMYEKAASELRAVPRSDFKAISEVVNGEILQ